MNDGATIYARGKDVIAATIGNEIAMLDISRGVYHHLNDTGTEIWNLLAEPMSFSVLTNTLAEMFDSPSDIIVNEVGSFLEMLVDKHIVERRLPE